MRWVWQVAGVWDALIAGRNDEARARCALMVGAADQASIDQGSWLISSVSLLEAPPPYQQFATHVAPTIQEAQHTMLYDQRWMDLFLSHLKEVDSYVLCGNKEEARGQVKPRQERSTWRRGRPSKSQSQGEGQSKVEGPEGWSRRSGGVKMEVCEEEAAKAGQPPLIDHSQPSIHLPGSRAPVFHGRKLLKSCLRYILKGKCRLSSFARSFVARRFDQSDPFGTACRSVFPMPLPYPEILREGSLEDSLKGSVKRWVCGVVICLNYLYLGRPRSAGREVWLGKALTTKKWMVVRRLEHLAAAWFHVSPVGPEQMGRTAGKVETMNDMLDSLELQATAIGHFGPNYFPAGSQVDQPGDDMRSGCRQIGTSESSSMSTFKALGPSRLSFIRTPSFNPGPYLDPLSRRIFEDPLHERMSPAAFIGRPPKLRVHCSRSDKIRLFELLDASNRLALFEAREVTPEFGSGLFAVVKDMDRDRMILDSRGANCLETPPGRWIKSLANGESLTKLSLEATETLLVSGNDLRDFYYLFQASSSRAKRNVLV